MLNILLDLVLDFITSGAGPETDRGLIGTLTFAAVALLCVSVPLCGR